LTKKDVDTLVKAVEYEVLRKLGLT